jgi:hypothetical protein
MVRLGDTKYRKRKYPRLPIVVLCHISRRDTGEIMGQGCVLNYSKGGLALVSTVKLSFDAQVNINVDGLDHKGFITARVANSRPVLENLNAYGLEYEGFNPLQRIQIVKKFQKLGRMLVGSNLT